MKTIKQQILSYAKKSYGDVPDAPFRTAPTYLVLRHGDTRKWYALFMDVPRERLGLPGSESVDILDIKCDPMLSGSLRMGKGFLPAYHMNRDSWITILLDGTVPAKDIIPLLDMSYERTREKSKRSGSLLRNTQIDFVSLLKDLRTKDHVPCPLCRKGYFIPVGEKESAHGFYCSNCKEKLKID